MIVYPFVNAEASKGITRAIRLSWVTVTILLIYLNYGTPAVDS